MKPPIAKTQRGAPGPPHSGTDPLLSGLNRAQRDAVTTTEGPLLVLAGAGTGKTRVITYRIAHLLGRGTPPESILAVTFTNKAAREMRERVTQILGRRPEGLTLSTFHSLGARMLRREAGLLGYRSNYNIYDTADQIGLVRTIVREVCGVREAGGASAGLDPKAILGSISRAKNRSLLPDELAAEAGDDWESLVAAVYERYQGNLRAMNCVDFDDLILLPGRLLQKEPEVAHRYRVRFRYVMVDEYQDTNGAQYRFLRSIVGPERNLCVVGDDDQSIYGFRGAEMDKILGFERDFPGARVVKLEENYRSTSDILNLANAVIEGSLARHKKTLRSTRGSGARVRCVGVRDEIHEVDQALGEIQALHHRGTPWSSMAVLMRAAIQARPFEEKLRLRRIPYTLVGGQSYFDRKEIRDVLAYWMVALNPTDDFSLLRILNVPRRGFGNASMEKLSETARASGTPIRAVLRRVAGGEGDFPSALRASSGRLADAFDRATERAARREFGAMARGLIEDASYADAVAELYPDPVARQARWACVEELFRSVDRWAAEEIDGDLSEFVAAIRMDHEEPRGEDRKETRGLSLMTLHSAKGLEFEHVFLVGVEEDLLPHRRSVEEGDKALEEERRLFYVGITRARKTLTILHAKTRSARGRTYPRKPSRFLEEVSGRGLLEEVEVNPDVAASADEVEDFLRLYKKLREEP